MKILTIIPARGGSKGVPRKNIKLLGGKPLIAWTIEAAQQVEGLRIATSSEKLDVAMIAVQYNIYFVTRPLELAQDDTPMLPVVQHAIKRVEFWTDFAFDWIMLLQPTTPFRSADDIKAAIALAEAGDCDSVISVVKVGDHHPARMYSIDGDYMKALYPDEETKRRQDLSPLYLRNGAIYLTRRDVIMGASPLAGTGWYPGRMWGEKVKPYVMPEERSVNIDTMTDWKLAEAMIAND